MRSILLSNTPQWTPPVSWQDQQTFCLCWSGRITIHGTEAGNVTLSPRHLTCCPDLPRSVELSGGNALIWQPTDETPFPLHAPQALDPWATEVLQRFFHHGDQTPSRLEATLTYLTEEWNAGPDHDRPDSEETRVLQHLADHIDRDLSVEDLARHLGRSRTATLRFCRERLGAPPMRLLAEMRIQRAKDLLLQPGLTISQVGYQVGYSSLPPFSHFFKKHTGVSPRRYRSNGEWLL